MRITGGAASGIRLKTLDIPQLRPATDMLRQAIFNSLASIIPGQRFLDLFAGCGAYGLEAFSRGAVGGMFVEMHPKLKLIIEENLAAVAKSAQRQASDCQVRQADALRLTPPQGEFDLVFCDPPYEMIAGNIEVLRRQAFGALKPGGLWIMEYPGELALEQMEGFARLKTLGGKGSRAPNVGMFQKR